MTAKAKRAPVGPQGIETTLGHLLHAVEALRRLSELRLPVKTAYHLSKLLGLVLAETNHFEAERLKWVAEFSEPGAPPNQRRVTEANMAAFQARMQELVDLPVTIPWQPIDLAALGAAEVTGADLLALGPLATMTNPPETSGEKSI